MPDDVRQLEVADLPAAWELTRLAFGTDPEPPPAWLTDRPGRSGWGVFDGSGRLVAKAVDRQQGHWFGGRLVPASGIAGVAVVPELRGTGLARRVLTRLLAAARDRGAVISTMFRTTPLPYRRLGWEEVGGLTWVAVPTSALAMVHRPDGVSLRPATATDVPAVLAAYQTVAQAGTGLMERTAPIVDPAPAAVLGGHDGLTVAVDAGGAVMGYASWDRGPGYDANARIAVPELIGLTAPATTALLTMLGSWASVAPTVLLRLPDPDPTAYVAALTGSRTESHDRWMLRVVDAEGAVAARGWPPHLTGSVDLALADDVCPWNAGPFRLHLADGTGRLEPGGTGAVQVSARGLAVLYAGAASPAVLRRAGLLFGGDAADDAFLSAASAGPAPALLDYF